jgi:hypothetical protein
MAGGIFGLVKVRVLDRGKAAGGRAALENEGRVDAERIGAAAEKPHSGARVLHRADVRPRQFDAGIARQAEPVVDGCADIPARGERAAQAHDVRFVFVAGHESAAVHEHDERPSFGGVAGRLVDVAEQGL